MAEEIAWLIERADPNNPGCVMPDSFLGIQGRFDGHNGSGVLMWMSGAHNGLRFARKQDAAMFIGMMTTLMDEKPHRESLIGLRSGDPAAVPVEHSWGDPSHHINP